MQILHFTVNGQNIHAETQDLLVVEGSRRYVYAAFVLDDAWDGLTVCALFENDSLHSDAVKKIITQEPVEVPPEVLVTGRLRIGLVGLADDGAVRLTTKRMFDAIPVYQSGGTGGEDAQTVTPELWEQSLSAIGSLGELETENKSNLVAAINEARRMGAGDSAGYTPIKGTDYFTDADKQEIAEAAAEMVSIPTQLPNPNALTFTGAVNGSYDGSEPVTVEIPADGGTVEDLPVLQSFTIEDDETNTIEFTNLQNLTEFEVEISWTWSSTTGVSGIALWLKAGFGVWRDQTPILNNGLNRNVTGKIVFKGKRLSNTVNNIAIIGGVTGSYSSSCVRRISESETVDYIGLKLTTSDVFFVNGTTVILRGR